MSRYAKPPSACGSCFPRVSGDEPAYSLVVTPVRVFSPRERG